MIDKLEQIRIDFEVLSKTFDVNVNNELKSLSHNLRDICEINSDIKHSISNTHWSVMHNKMHIETINSTKTSLLSTYIEILYVIKEHYDWDSLNIIVEKIMQTEEMQALYNDSFWNFTSDGTPIKSRIFIKGKILINPILQIFQYSCRYEKSEKDFTYLSKLNLNINWSYDIQRKYIYFWERQLKRYFIISATPLVEEYYQALNRWLGKREFSDEWIQKVQNIKHSWQWYKELDIINKIVSIIGEPPQALFNGKIDDRDHPARSLPMLLSIFTKINVFDIPKITIRNLAWAKASINKPNYPYSLDPTISSPSDFTLNYYHKKQLFDYLLSKNIVYESALFDEIIFSMSENNSDLYVENSKQLAETYKLYNMKSFGANAIYSTRYINDFDLFTNTYNKILSDVFNYMFKNLENKSNENFDIKSDNLQFLKYKKLAVIMGPAGTGKTYTVKEFIKDNISFGCLIITPTLRASTVYDDISRDNITFKTIQAITPKKTKEFNPLTTLADKKIIVFDEISMYNDDNWRIVAMVLNNITNQKVFLIGDDRQIQPIYSNDRSKIIKFLAKQWGVLIDFENEKNKRVSTKNANASAILELLKNLRNEKFNPKDKGYSGLIYTYNGLRDVHELIKKLVIDHLDYTFIVQKNVGLLGADLLNATHTHLSKDDSDNLIFEKNEKVILHKTIDKSQQFYNNTEALIIERRAVGETLQYVLSNRKGYKTIYNCEPGFEEFGPIMFITAHKSQGCTIKSVVVVIESDVIDFNWLYTACSRVSEDLIILLPSTFKEITKIPQTNNYEKYYKNLLK